LKNKAVARLVEDQNRMKQAIQIASVDIETNRKALKGHRAKARRFLSGGIVGTVATAGLAWFLTESTSTSSQLLEDTNPAVEEIPSETKAEANL
jgi:hypothetical protein